MMSLAVLALLAASPAQGADTPGVTGEPAGGHETAVAAPAETPRGLEAESGADGSAPSAVREGEPGAVTRSREASGPQTCRVEVRPTPRLPSTSVLGWSARRLEHVDLWVHVSDRDLATAIEVEVLTPNGHLYQRLVAAPPETSDDAADEQARPTATARLPVAGTQITKRGIYGRWSVVPYVEGHPEPCGSATSFSLAP